MSNRLESHAHQNSKELLTRWLREAAEKVGLDGLAKFPAEADPYTAIQLRVNRAKRSRWGVWQEYPILSDCQGIAPVWDEVSSRWKRRPPTYDEVVDGGDRPMAVVDIAVQHKGIIAYAIEVVHKHRCNPRKIGFLRPHLTLLEIPAYWVLGQVDRPKEIPAEFFL